MTVFLETDFFSNYPAIFCIVGCSALELFQRKSGWGAAMQGKQRKGRASQGRLESDRQGKTRSSGHVEERQGSFFTLHPTVFFA